MFSHVLRHCLEQQPDEEKNKECFPNVKQVFLLYLVGSLVTLLAY